MTEIGPESAINFARTAMGLHAGAGARAWRVQRLDRPGEAYYLVVFGDDAASVAVATVDASGGRMMETARLEGRGPHLVVDSARAVSLVGGPDDAQPALVWKPCRASRSMLYPIWAIRTAQGTAYVDQQGHVWRELDLGHPGG